MVVVVVMEEEEEADEVDGMREIFNSSPVTVTPCTSQFKVEKMSRKSSSASSGVLILRLPSSPLITKTIIVMTTSESWLNRSERSVDDSGNRNC